MFTGIVSHIGKLKKKEGARYIFQTESSFCERLRESVSVAVNGVCVTVNEKPGKTDFSIEIMPETERKTMLCELKIGDPVNLELPMTAESFVSGHFLQGHVDGTGRIVSITKDENSWIFTITLPEKLSYYVVEKGAIALNGVSMTVISESRTYFKVGVIPYTWDHTTFKKAKVNDLVNIEVDILGKYVGKQLMQYRIDKKKA